VAYLVPDEKHNNADFMRFAIFLHTQIQQTPETLLLALVAWWITTIHEHEGSIRGACFCSTV
jgi:hypothetical protein